MKKHLLKTVWATCAAISFLAVSCKKNAEINSQNTGSFADTAGALKTAASADFPNMGMAVTYGPMSTIPAYLAAVKREANNVTFGNELKEGSVVSSTGVYNYSTADALYALCASNGLGVFGHTLVWHSQQNAVYLNSLIAPQVTAPVTTNILVNGTFEAGSATAFTNWSAYNGASSISAGTAANEVHGGSRSFKATVAAAGNPYAVQLASDLFNTTVGTTYTMSFYLKAASAGGKMRISTGTTAQYSADYNTTTDWALYTYSFVAKDAQSRVLFDVGYTANTYYIDDASVTGPPAGVTTNLTAAQQTAIIDAEMNRYITTTMTRYAGKIKAWDVVNEPLLDNGAVRTNGNYTIPAANVTNQFLYAQYLGSKYDNNYIIKAFKYAKAADPTALLFINDYNLEYATAKTDSMKALVVAANKYGAAIDGIGTQMHITLGANLANIDYSFKTLASTGLKIRISELDIVMNGLKANPFVPTATLLAYQAAMYKYVIQSYIKNVPAAQRYGVTVWGVSDTDSWLNTATSPDAPLLFNANYNKKPAYSGFKQGL